MTELFNPEWLRRVARCWIAVAAITYVVVMFMRTRVRAEDGIRDPFGADFINYWSGAYLALHGRVAEVYNFVAFHDFETSLIGSPIDFYHYSHPPVLLLLTAPLALLPYAPALVVWLASTWYAFYCSLKLAIGRHAFLLSLAAPATFINALTGQNGALTAAAMGGGLLLADRRPALAGMLFGLLIYKPHLGLMLPVAMLAGRRWAVVGAAAATAILLIAATLMMFGPGVWLDYQHNLGVLRAVILDDGTGVWHRMVSVFVLIRHLGGGVALSYVVQATVALATALVVGWSWSRGHPAHIRNAFVVVGTCFATPYVQDYDLVVGVFAAVWLKVAQRDTQIAPLWIDLAVAMLLLLPLLAAPLAKSTGLVVGPLFLMAPFLLLGACAWYQPRTSCSAISG